MNLDIDWQWHQFEQLNPNQMAAMFALRQDVFIVEQDCPYSDIDGQDPQAHHLLAWSGDTLVATLRVFDSYPAYDNHCSIGRICTHQTVRQYGIGRELVANAIEFIGQQFPNKAIQIGAQHYLKRFYQGFGFEQISDIYDEDGIDHILMLKSSATTLKLL